MKLSDQQFAFAKDIIELEYWMVQQGYKFTYGEAWRPDEMQQIYYEKGLSKIKERGPHGHRLARDYNFWIDGKLTWDKEKIQPIGDYWESLNSLNEWGGNWTNFIDTPHFQRRKVD